MSKDNYCGVVKNDCHWIYEARQLEQKNKGLEDLAVKFSKENEIIREQLSKEIEHHIKTRTKLRREIEELRRKNVGLSKELRWLRRKEKEFWNPIHKALKTAEDALEKIKDKIEYYEKENCTEEGRLDEMLVWSTEALSEIRAVKGEDGECKKHEYAIANGYEYRCVKCNREREDE